MNHWQITVTFEASDLDAADALMNATLDTVNRHVKGAVLALTSIPEDGTEYMLDQWDENQPHIVFIPNDEDVYTPDLEDVWSDR